MSQVFTGPRAIFSLNDTKVAFASDCNYTINHELQKIDVLDKINAVEYAEVGYDVSFSCSVFRVADQSATNLGVKPTLENILTQPELTASIVDRVTGKTLLRVTGVKLMSVSGGFGARSSGTETWNFCGLRATDEASS